MTVKDTIDALRAENAALIDANTALQAEVDRLNGQLRTAEFEKAGLKAAIRDLKAFHRAALAANGRAA